MQAITTPRMGLVDRLLGHLVDGDPLFPFIDSEAVENIETIARLALDPHDGGLHSAQFPRALHALRAPAWRLRTQRQKATRQWRESGIGTHSRRYTRHRSLQSTA